MDPRVYYHNYMVLSLLPGTRMGLGTSEHFPLAHYLSGGFYYLTRKSRSGKAMPQLLPFVRCGIVDIIDPQLYFPLTVSRSFHPVLISIMGDQGGLPQLE